MLYIPDLADDPSTLEAAYRYTRAGWYVVPLRPRSKNPGGVLGKDWHLGSSRDPQVITSWYAGSDYGIGLHLGRSGAIAFDHDHGELHPALLRAMKTDYPPIQQTRPGRMHMLYRMPPGRMFGNSGGGLGTDWGEVRGRNGIIVVAPSEHPESSGRYQWISTGELPELPAEVAELLPEAGEAIDCATDAEVAAFLAAHGSEANEEALEMLLRNVERGLDSGARHPLFVSWTAAAMREARAGLYDAKLAAHTLESLFHGAEGKGEGRTRTRAEAMAEWAAILAWAVAQAMISDPGATRARVEDLTGPALTISGRATSFWDRRPAFALMRSWALSRGLSPWSLFGISMLRVLGTIPPPVKLPAIIGARASLNMTVVLVGAPGAGKSVALQAADDMLALDGVLEPAPVLELGSGEGIAHAFAHRDRKGNLVTDHTSVIFTVDEVERLTKAASWQGSTILPVLRTLWSGGPLGQRNTGREKTILIPGGTYRAGVLIAAQPEMLRPLVEDVYSGTAQRLLLLDARVDLPWPWPAEPTEHLRVLSHAFPSQTLYVPDEIRDELRRAHARRVAFNGTDDGHAGLMQLKVAEKFAMVDGNQHIDGQDWADAAEVIEHSMKTLGWVKGLIAARVGAEAEANTEAEARRRIRIDERISETAVARVARRLGDRFSGQTVTWRDVCQAVAGRDREHLEEAISTLVVAGLATDSGGKRGRRVNFV